MKEKFLPIGTLVYLKDRKKKVMITSYLVFSKGDSEKKEIYDYGACIYPHGIIDSNYSFAFNHDDIAEILFNGHEDEEFKEFNNRLRKLEKDLKKENNI